MLQSRLFTRTRKDAPKDEVSKNAELLIRGGYIHKELAGAYAFLPLGLRVLKKVEEIIREEMNALGGQEVSMTALQEKTVWEKTGRWDDAVLDIWFKSALKSGSEVGLATTHEEPLTALLTEYVSSYRDLPFSVYQFQTKFRNELRAKSGIMRGREFVMKDLYSFSKDQAEHDAFYEKVKDSYMKIFERVGLGEHTFVTRASGGSFSKFSHEFQTLTEAGEDVIYIIDEDKKEAINKEIYEGEGGREAKSVEVGNIFTLGTRFSDALGLNFKDEAGEAAPVIMGSYGIGLGRLIGTVVETLSDDKGIVWPESIAPFKVHILLLSQDNKKFADEVYEALRENGVEALYDDRDARAGEKFADADLLGMPYQVIVGNKISDTGLFELKVRKTGETRELSLKDLLNELSK